jgi:hypothetical protein
MFYTKKTIEQQRNRLPRNYRDNYTATQLDRILIDGELITGYFEYSFLEEKSYLEQPVRSDDGSIQELENYATFLTPRLIIRYNMMDIEDYRKLMKMLKQKNSFTVECYDIVEDRRVTHEMYFAPPQMPIIYQQYLMTLGVQEYTIELIGTNRRNKFKVTYDFNFSSSSEGGNLSAWFDTYYPGESKTQTKVDIPYSEKYTVGDVRLSNGQFLATISPMALKGWSEVQYADPQRHPIYKDGDSYFFSKDIVLYAQWE